MGSSLHAPSLRRVWQPRLERNGVLKMCKIGRHARNSRASGIKLMIAKGNRKLFMARQVLNAIAMERLGFWIAFVVSVLSLVERSVAGEMCVMPLLLGQHGSPYILLQI